MNEGVRGKLAAKFRAITADRLEKLNTSFMELEASPTNAEASEIVARELHSLKGEAKMMGFHTIHALTHRIEELIHAFRKGQLVLNRAVSDTMFQVFDQISALAQEPPGAVLDEAALADLSARVDALLGLTAAPAVVPAPAPAPAARSAERPSFPSPPPAPPPEDVDADVTVSGVEPIDQDFPTDEVPGEGTEEVARPEAAAQEDFLRVDRQQLDVVTRLVGEIVLGQGRRESHLKVTRSLVDQLGELLQRGSAAEMSKEGVRIAKQLRQVLALSTDETFRNRISVEECENAVKQVRLLPLSTAFSQLRRAARDLAKEQGKEVQVDLSGGQILVDKQVLDLLEEPLLHVIRNSIDHGLELPAERAGTGKPAKARLSLVAALQGSRIQITVTDDGRGIDPARLRRIAVQRGAIESDEAAGLSDAEILEVIFRSGFSTRSEVTELSGRGVGLSVVREKLNAAGGSVSVQSQSGKGTIFRLTAPTSLVISRVLLVEDQGGYFAFPLEMVRRTGLFLATDVDRGPSGSSVRVDGRRIPVLPLAPILGTAQGESEGDDLIPILIVEYDGSRLGLIIERFGGVIAAVQRPFDKFLEGLRLFHGSIVLPGGEIALLVNVPELLHEAAGGVVRTRQAQSAKRANHVLVVDDSEFTRDMVVGLMRQLGLDVTDAVDGRQGLEKFQETRPDLVFTDLDMPVLDGFGLLKELRALPDGRDVPVIVFSTRGSAEDKARAAELGADAYLVKTEFSEDLLRQTVGRFLAKGQG